MKTHKLIFLINKGGKSSFFKSNMKVQILISMKFVRKTGRFFLQSIKISKAFRNIPIVWPESRKKNSLPIA